VDRQGPGIIRHHWADAEVGTLGVQYCKSLVGIGKVGKLVLDEDT